jgi:ribose transport system permease protein
VTAWARRAAPTLSAWALCVVLFAIGAIHSSGFAAWDNIRDLLVFASFVGFAAVGETLVVLGGGLDLSVPWVIAFGGIQLSHWASIGGGAGIVAVVAVGAAIGFVNGVGVAWLRVPPIVMTLAVGGLVQAYLLAIGLLQSTGNQLPAAAVDIATSRVAGVPIVALIWLGVALLVGGLLARAALGRKIYAVGASETVAELSGVDVRRVRLQTYMLSGAFASFAGVVISGYVGQTYLDIGNPYLFTSIAAVIVGGASILGGRGTYWGTVAGAMTLTVLGAMLPLFGLSPAGLDIVYGIVILVGVWASTAGGALVLGRIRHHRRRSPQLPGAEVQHAP